MFFFNISHWCHPVPHKTVFKSLDYSVRVFLGFFVCRTSINHLWNMPNYFQPCSDKKLCILGFLVWFDHGCLSTHKKNAIAGLATMILVEEAEKTGKTLNDATGIGLGIGIVEATWNAPHLKKKTPYERKSWRDHRKYIPFMSTHVVVTINNKACCLSHSLV